MTASDDHSRKYSQVHAITFVAAVLAALFAFTTLLSAYYRSELRARAERYFHTAEQLAQQGHLLPAVDDYRAALSYAHTNSRYLLALSTALVRLGHLNEANSHLLQLAESQPNNSTVNLLLARIAAQQDRTEDAVTYYHRAIYGLWQADAQQNRTQTRFEMVEFLTRAGRKNQVVAELIQLASDTPDNAARDRAGELLLKMGWPANAADVFRDVLRSNPADLQALSGLADALLAQGDYRQAEAAYRRVLRNHPKDEPAREKLQQLGHALALDPSLTSLSAAQQYQRSRDLVRATLQSAQQCPALSNPGGTTSADDLLRRAQQLIANPAGSRGKASAQPLVDMAQELWKARTAGCGPLRPDEQSLSLVMREVAK